MMRAMRTLALSLFCASASAQNGIREVDFANFSHPWPADTEYVPETWQWLPGPFPAALPLRQGHYPFPEPGPFAQLVSVAYGDLDGDGQEEAAVDVLYSTGGTANWHYLYIYTAAPGAPRLTGLLRSGSRGFGGLLSASADRRLLTLEFADADRREGDCCSRGLIRVRYRYTGGRFAEVLQPEKDSLRFAHSDRPASRKLLAGLHLPPVRWQGRSCPPSAFRSAQWAPGGHILYFIADCSLTTGALLARRAATGAATVLIPDAVEVQVIETGRYRGFLIASQRTRPAGATVPAYPYFLFRSDGTRLQAAGDETEDLAAVAGRFERR